MSVRIALLPRGRPDGSPVRLPPPLVRLVRDGVRRLARSSAASFGARAALTACAAYAIASLVGLEQPMWAPVSALIVLQGSARGTVRAMTDRIVGTLAGAGTAVLAAVALAPLGAPPILQIAVAVGLVAAGVAAFRPAARVATWTSVIVLMSAVAPGHPLTNAAWRIADVAVGAVVATLLGLVFKAPAVDRTFRSELGLALVSMAEAIRRTASGDERVASADAAEVALRRCEELAAGAVRRGTASCADPAPVVEATRRLWHSLLTLGRLAAPVRGDAGVAVNVVVEEATAMLATHLDALADALDGLCEPPDPADLDDIVVAVAAAVRGLRADGVMRRLSDGEAQAVYLRRFALERAVRDLADVIERAAVAA